MEIRRIITITLLTLALIIISTTTAAAISCDSGDICVNQSGWWRDGGTLNASTTPIQAAVDNATAGETICVAAGSYSENVDIATSHLTLRGEGASVVIVTAVSSSDQVFEVTADYVNISGFNATGATPGPPYYNSAAGFYLNNADHCNISKNTASNYIRGIYLHFSSNNTLANNTANSNKYHGICLSSSSNNTLVSNNCTNNKNGICLGHASNNTLANNTANSNNDYGICLSSSSNNTLVSNTISENKLNFDVSGSSLSKYTQNIDTSNTVDGKPIYYWINQKDRQIPGDAGFVGVVNGKNITVRNLTLTNNRKGVLFAYTDNSRIENVTTSNNYYGIYLVSSSNNMLANNTASNRYYGIRLDSSSDNKLANNTANSNRDHGIYLYHSNNNTLTNNTANSNRDHGISLYHSSNNTLANNIANLNEHLGIYLYHSSNNTLANNIANLNEYHGISLYHSCNNTLTNNTTNLNGDLGIYLYRSNNNTLTNNTASNNHFGIILSSSSNNTLTNNTASNNYYGIFLRHLSNNTLANNIASNNRKGIYLDSSSDNTLVSNTMSENMYNFDVSGSSLSEYTHNIDINNTVDGKPIYYWVDQKDRQIPSDAGFVGVVNGINITVKDLRLTNNGEGVLFAYTKNSRIENVTTSNNCKGIYLSSSRNNTLVNNTADSNSWYGIKLQFHSSNNLIYNNYFNNTENADDDGSNQWNITKTKGTNIIGGPFLGGNYWSDYAGVDNDGDGLGDTLTPYNPTFFMTNDGDYHPLVPTAAPDPTYIPPDPVNLAHTPGNYWVNYTWSPGAGNTTDSYNVSLNGTWTNGTTSTFANTSVGPSGWANITVFAYNASGTGMQSAGSLSDEVQAPCADDTTPPVITITTPEPYGLYTVGMTLNFSAIGSESGVATIVGNLTNTSGMSQFVENGSTPEVGVYTLVVTATDNAGNTNESDPVFFVVYDPNGGHATGGSWFYPDGESTLPGGKANFGFTARYEESSSTGKLNFQYKDADITLKLKSMSIDWLVINNVSAQFQGTGTINGDGLYTFRVQAKDNGEPGVDVDHFDIRIWNGTDTEADPYHKAKNTIADGNIQVHTK